MEKRYGVCEKFSLKNDYNSSKNQTALIK